MKFWHSLQFTGTGDLLSLARTVERETPFHGVFLGDHLVHPEHVLSTYPNTSDGRPGWPAATHWPDLGATMGAIVAATHRLEVTTSIMVLPLRHPIVVAKMLATLSVLSDRRVSLGIGVGWMEDEFRALGVDFHTRGRRCDEMIDVMRLLWSGEMTEFNGEFFEFPRLASNPKPLEPVPLYVSGFSRASMRRAVEKGDGWISGNTAPERVLEALPVITRMLADAGRDDGSFELIVTAKPDLEFLKRLRDLGVTSVFSYPHAERYARTPTVREITDDLLRYSESIIEKLGS